MIARLQVRKARYLASLYLFGLAFALGLVAILQLDDDLSEVVRLRRDDPISDLLQWLPATGESERSYAAWVTLPDAPMSVGEALDRLGLSPRPFALGRSSEFQRTVGLSSSQVTGWASAPGAGVSILAGDFSGPELEGSLTSAGYEQSRWRGILIWTALSPREAQSAIEGDDLRAMNVVVPLGNRILLAVNRLAAEAALEAAAGQRASLADRPELERWIASNDLAGIMVVDKRDLAVECGVAGPWRKSDFAASSGRTVGVAYWRRASGEPVTSVWIELDDERVAEANLVAFDLGWRHGFINQIGIGGPVSALADVAEVSKSGAFVIADLVEGRDNGWARSGVRYLVEVCEHASSGVPAGQPDRIAPAASPSPEESP